MAGVSAARAWPDDTDILQLQGIEEPYLHVTIVGPSD